MAPRLQSARPPPIAGQQRPVIIDHMIDNRPQADRILGARLMGSAKRLGRRELPDDEYAAAVAELRELAAGRADLLAETAGLLEGFGEGESNT